MCLAINNAIAHIVCISILLFAFFSEIFLQKFNFNKLCETSRNYLLLLHFSLVIYAFAMSSVSTLQRIRSFVVLGKSLLIINF